MSDAAMVKLFLAVVGGDDDGRIIIAPHFLEIGQKQAQAAGLGKGLPGVPGVGLPGLPAGMKLPGGLPGLGGGLPGLPKKK